MSRPCRTRRCDRPAHQDLAICLACCGDLERHLGDVPALAAELDLQISRQTATGNGGGARSTTRPLAFDSRASDVAHRLRNTLGTWVRDIGGNPPADNPAAMALWLLARMDVLRKHPAAEQICGDFDSLLAAPRRSFAGGAVWRAIDRRPEQIYAGICSIATDAGECPEVLYADAGKSTVTCRACRWEHNVPARRQVMLDALEDRLMTAFEIARAAAHLQVVDSSGRAEKLIATWVDRKRIQARGVNAKGRPTYRFGEVRDLLATTPTRGSRGVTLTAG
jgi:hypothetical protein